MIPAGVVALLAFIAACEGKSTAKDPWASPTTSPGQPVAGKDPWGSDRPTPSAEAPSPAAAPAGEGVGLPNGEWKCFYSGSTIMLDGFTLTGGSFSSPSGDGTVSIDGQYVVFHGGRFDGWRWALNQHVDGRPYIVFGGGNHRDAVPGRGAAHGDAQCDAPS